MSSFHHVAISVRNLEKSQTFYETLGFKVVHRWDSDDDSLSIVHAKLGDVFLEIFAYKSNENLPELELDVANNLPSVGIKHMALSVVDINAAFEAMMDSGYKIGNPAVKAGRTNIDYFFICDPDGVWLEIVQDDRGY